MRFFETLIGDENFTFFASDKIYWILGTIYPSIIQELLGILLTRKVEEIFRPNTSSIIHLLLTRTEFDDSSKNFFLPAENVPFCIFQWQKEQDLSRNVF